MDRTIIEAHLAMVDRHVADGERLVARQRELLRGLEPGGHGAVIGRALLVQFEELLAQHIAHRDRLRRELLQCRS
ncbi:MAG TPA: hypothetical protein VKX28_09010 [Xanthobacteraceae bacterium]|nr:hypothetical protein [Xanthobacteraceae bacterium]